MDSGKTTPGDEGERGTENVVRLPRDWLGPRDELVPIGSGARVAQAADDAQTDALPPTAASFWDEDSGSLQAPMQAPAGMWQPTPAERQVQPAPRRLRSRFGWAVTGVFISRRRVTATVGVLAAGLLLVLAVIGQSEGGTHNASDKTASVPKKTPGHTATGANNARPEAKTPVVNAIRPQPQSHRSARARAHAGRSRARKHRIQVTTIHRRHRNRSTPRPTNSTSEPVVGTTTPTYTPTPASSPATSPPATTSAPSSPSASTDRASSASSQHQPAFGASGSLGPGSSPDS